MSQSHSLNISVEILQDLVNEVVKEDPIDYGTLRIDEQALRKLCCQSVLDLFTITANNFTLEDVIYVLTSSMAKLIEENTVLIAKELNRNEDLNINEQTRLLLNKVMK